MINLMMFFDVECCLLPVKICGVFDSLYGVKLLSEPGR